MEIEKSVIDMIFSKTELYHKKDDITYYHRENGPAALIYNTYPDGTTRIMAEHYYYYNVLMTKEEWEKEVAWKKQLKNTPMGEIY